ncbi:hypothetical protein N7403_30485 [Pseudomonas nitroreducens]|uniref:hypothetical protein n=1 Tax=Pseudomonas nitroreducens TaxID=46680 RepID=UPI00244B0029|nr:hypothetical protein [Pseudomonas nitroreducens]MDG9858197.1 hypothetical protein [Pseudomonas nitroreducens]
MNIRCAVCNTPVYQIEWWTDHATGAAVIRAHCHGETDEMWVPISMLDQMSSEARDEMSNQEGIAFSKNLLAKEES